MSDGSRENTAGNVPGSSVACALILGANIDVVILADLRGLRDRLYLRLNQVQHCVRISASQEELDHDCSGRLEKPSVL
jgi:hypothetical protein